MFQRSADSAPRRLQQRPQRTRVHRITLRLSVLSDHQEQILMPTRGTSIKKIIVPLSMNENDFHDLLTRTFPVLRAQEIELCKVDRHRRIILLQIAPITPATIKANTGAMRPAIYVRTKGLKVKFLINIPLKVDSEVEAQKTCRYLLDALIDGFKEEDRKFVKDKNGKEVLEDTAVIFGLNGKHSPELVQVLKNLESFKYDCKIRYSIITYTWGSGGTIASDATDTPYQDIREHLKNNAAATKLVQELRENDRSCLVYFSFVDSDTFRFNFIYSEYLKIVSKELKKDPPIPPTVMSTGYEFTHERDYHIASDLDRQIRTALAEVNPLFLYYPEPNFCVLVEDNENTIKESFIKRRRGKDQYKMESSVLIKQVKERFNFKAVFSNENPIIIITPIRFKLSGDGLKTGQSTLNERNLAIGIYCNGVLKCRETYNGVNCPNDPQVQKGVYYRNLNFIKDLYKCDDKNFEELSKKNPFTINESDATELVEAIREARECRKLFEELNEKFKNY